MYKEDRIKSILDNIFKLKERKDFESTILKSYIHYINTYGIDDLNELNSLVALEEDWEDKHYEIVPSNGLKSYSFLFKNNPVIKNDKAE